MGEQDDDMRDSIQSLEAKFERLEKKVDQLPTKDDLTKFATKDDLAKFATRDDLVAFKDEIVKNFKVLVEDAKESVKMAAEGYGTTLERIEIDLRELNKKVDNGLSDHSHILANHNDRLVELEARRRR